MRALGLIGLVLALAVVGLVAKKQMAGVASPAEPVVSAGGEAQPPQAQQVLQQVKDALDAAAKTRQMPDDH